MELTFVVPGPPVPWPRARTRAVKSATSSTGMTVVHFHEKKSKAAAAKAEGIARARLARPPGWPLDAAYQVLLVLFRNPPKRLGKRARASFLNCPVRPDCDNFLKAIMDNLNGVLWADDGQVFDARVVKVFGPPQTTVMVRAVAPEADSGLVRVLQQWTAGP